MHTVPPHDAVAGVWCSVSTTRIIELIFSTCFYLQENVCLFIFFRKTKQHFAQASFMLSSESVFGDKIVIRVLWPPGSPDLNPCDQLLLVERV